MPKISICVPNLNNRPFLPERFETIFNQTFQDWELIVCDGYSDDGAWEYIQKLAASEPRMQIFQSPRKGIYAGFNDCIGQARGEFVYVATSDDTMAQDCLEKLVAALQSQPECDLAHCSLRVIGDNAEKMNGWWQHDSLFMRSTGKFSERSHIRRAPFDGLLHLYGDTVYVSITQLLIRRSFFDRIGLFDNRWGSIGDFHWNMRASLLANTVHVPDTWGGWRLHSAQATGGAGHGSEEHRKKIEEMIDDVLQQNFEKLPTNLRPLLKNKWRNYFKDRWLFQKQIDALPTRRLRASFLIKQALSGSPLIWYYLGRRLKGIRGWPESPGIVVTNWLDSVGKKDSIITV